MADYEYVTGITGNRTAINIIAVGSLVFPSVTLTGGSLFVWSNKTITLAIGTTGVSLTLYDTSDDGWRLYYAIGVTASGVLKVTTAEANTAIDEIRCFAAAISDNALKYYFDDVNDNAGAIVLP